MQIDELHEKALISLNSHIQNFLPQKKIFGSYRYALLPPGKLFRPKISLLLLQDLNRDLFDQFSLTSNHAYFSSLLEIVHTYTLIHDDLPCMDNDDFRRGRPSLHKSYSEWEALLAGDGLLTLSYSLAGKLSSPFLPEILRLLGFLLGPKGLILGQYLDLSSQEEINFDQIMEIHSLKTGRLIQFSLIGSYLLTLESQNKITFRTIIDLYKFGHYLGLVFQLIDDFKDLEEINPSGHEGEINAFYLWPERSKWMLTNAYEKLIFISDRHKLVQLMNYVDSILGKYITRLTN